MKEILRNWGLDNMTATPINSYHESAWDIDGKFILKRNLNADEFAISHRLPLLLAAEGIFVAEYIPTLSGQPITPDGYCLMTKLRGAHIDLFEQPELACEMGRELAKLHTALKHIEPDIACKDSDLLADWRGSIKPTLLGIAPDNLLDDIEKWLTDSYPQLPRQLIHRDVHLKNVLFKDGKFTGWLDFDISQKNARLFDIAYLPSGLIIGETKNPAKVAVWRTICKDVLAGYDDIAPLSAAERAALFPLMTAIELLFAAFWHKRDNHKQRDLALELALWLHNEYL